MARPAGVNLSALSSRLATARSNSSMSTAAIGASSPRCSKRSATPRLAARSAKRKAMSSSTSARSSRIGWSLNWGSSSRARSPSERTMPAALRVLRSATSTRRRSSSRPGWSTQRWSSVSRQATVAVSGERRSCDRLDTLSRRKWSSRCSSSHCRRSVASRAWKPLRRRPNSSSLAAADGTGGSGSAAAPRKPSRAAAATSSLSPRSGRVTAAMIQAASAVASRITASTAPSAGETKLLASSSSRDAGRPGRRQTRYR